MADLIRAIDQIAPLSLAEPWDKVGLHLGSSAQEIQRALLCIDLSEAVVREAVTRRCELIIAYHPPIFSPLRRLTDETWKERTLSLAIRKNIAVYSPHTALDNVANGLTDWLCDGLGVSLRRSAIIQRSTTDVVDTTDGGGGCGRVVSLRHPVHVKTLLRRIKTHLDLAYLSVALPTTATGQRRDKHRITSIAVCPGAGGSVFEHACSADLYLTGEMRHHDVFDLTQKGRVVVLCGHTQSERPYLKIYLKRLSAACGDSVQWFISRADRSDALVK